MIKVSAIVSLYNSMEYVEECLNDLVSQTLFKRGKLEIVVIDSASPQDERSVVEKFQRQYSNIVYHRTPERETLYQAWNRGLELASGEYITNANSDDRHHPEGLEILCRVLQAHSNVDLVYADVYESVVANERFSSNPRTCRYSYPNFFAPLSLLYYQFGCQPMWRKTVHSSIGQFNGELRAAGDWEFCIRFSLAGLRALRVPQVLGSFLHRPTSISQQDQTSVREQQEVKARFLTDDAILRLYEVEGIRSEGLHDKARVLTDFACRASSMSLPWLPGKLYREPQATIMSCLAAFEIMKDDPRTAWNLGVSLHEAAHYQEAIPFLQRGAALGDPTIMAALNKIQVGANVALPLLRI